MGDVLIKGKGMKMPKNCGQCILCLDDSRIANGYCMIFHRSVIMSKLDKNCPLVELPPHGRLIDADALTSVLETLKWKSGNPVIWDQMADIVKDIHTVIEAEDGEP